MKSHDSKNGNGVVKRSPALAIVSAETPKQWRSLEERAGDSQIALSARQEFPVGSDTLDPVSRRDFVGLMGASLALAGGAVSCYRPRQKIVPYVRRPPEVTPGNALHFATATEREGVGIGLLVDSHEGRPTKIEGNPDHPDGRGTSSAIDQALVLGLYDDNRARLLRMNRQPATWRAVVADIGKRVEAAASNGGAKIRFLVEPTSSPLLNDLRARVLQKLPQAKFVSFSGVAADGAVEGARLVFGKPLDARHDLANAKVIVALDSDFLADGPEQLKLARGFSQGREPGEGMNRLYVAEPCLTVTGGMADHRLRARGADILAVAQALAAEVAKTSGAESVAPLANASRAPGAVDGKWVAAVAKDLAKHRGKSVVIAGRRQPAAVHALAAAINHALGNVGATVNYVTPLRADALTGVEPLRALVEEIAADKVETLVITAKNPVFTAPADFKLGKLLERVPNVIYLSLHEDETAAVVPTVIPAAHELESWGDTRGLDGTVSLIQPLINPLWNGLGQADVLGAFIGLGDAGAHKLLKDYWHQRALTEGLATALTFETSWESWLGRGIVAGTGVVKPETVAPTLDAAVAEIGKQAGKSGGEGLELAFAVCPKVFDGRFGNSTWLQELPHPITKITWDNAVLVSIGTAAKLGVATGDIVEVKLRDASVRGPVYVQPGAADDVATVALGYGRSGAEAIAAGVGFNAGVLRSSDNPWFERGATLTKVGSNYRFGITQDHWKTEDREPVVVATLEEFLKHGSEFHEKVEEKRLRLPADQEIHKPWDYSKAEYKWAMSIDLNKCTGCGACVTACQAENNIPVVGRDNVRIGREMQWIRLDRYYSFKDEANEDDEVTMTSQPVGCLHCETAPCEYVCPVNATVHSDEGLNEMVYNRCIGTRYCSNNCPYKARRFNFLDYTSEASPVKKMATNPNVTVRSRGVMEKCTYCVQRIERKRIDARVEGRKIADGELVTACQQGCPSLAIEFGSLHDPAARVTKAHENERRYFLLNELNTRPRTTFLARVRNPNPELA